MATKKAAGKKAAKKTGDKKIEKVMGEYKRGSLKSSSGDKVTSRKQAVAIALSEAREAGADIPEKKKAPRKAKKS
ncbi:hypothetical protein F183_A01750 [Bryobacterales bacterium F-183]|nr:hypothetical protein F183_A01750 [Bryobacterales bacterium F-183]